MGTLAASLIATLIGVAVSTTTGVVMDKTTDKSLQESAHLQNVQATQTAVNNVSSVGTKLLAHGIEKGINVSQKVVSSGLSALSSLL